MIKNVSSTFKANCKKDSVKYREYIVIDNKEVDIKGNLSDTAYKDTTFFGKFNLKMLKFETENDIDYKKKEFTYYKEVDGEALKIGTFIVTDVSDSDTFESVNVTAYDYGLKFANPYTTNLDYKNGNITMFQVVQEICNNCDIELENTSLPNGSFIIDSNQFVNGEKYGDVICIVALENGMFATINSNNKLEFIFTNETDEIIEDYVELDDKRDTQPITSILVAPSEELATAGAVMKDQTLINQYGEHWLKIYDSYFANSTIKCQQLISAIFNQVKGFGYSSFKSEYSFLPYLSLGDKIKFKNKEGKLVDSIILRYETNYDEMILEAPSIINASVEYELPETPEETSKKALVKVDQANGEIELIAKATKELETKTTKLRLDVDKIEGEISNIADITTTTEGTGTLVANNINESEPIYLRIYPTNSDLKCLYPSETLYPSEDLVPLELYLLFHCTSEEYDISYILPDLYWLNKDVYDEFVLDYDKQECYVVRRVSVVDGVKTALTNSITENLPYPNIPLINGNYQISIPYQTTGYIYARLMVQNIYTNQFATKVELNSKIIQTSNEINLEVSKKVGNDEVISRINQTPENITIQANKVNINGVINAINGNTSTTINGDKITTGTITSTQIKSGTITADKVASDVITTTNFSAQQINADNIKTGTIDASKIGVTNLNANNITSGTLSANKINGGTITGSAVNLGSGKLKITTAGALNYYNNPGFLYCGGNTSNHPYVSALNVAQGSGGISFRDSGSRTDAGSQKASIYQSSSNLYINSNSAMYLDSGGTMNISSDSAGKFQTSSYLKLLSGSPFSSGTNAGSMYLYAGSNISLNSKSGHVYVGAGSSNNSRVATDSSGPSSRCLKENIKDFTKEEYNQALQLLHDMKLYTYNYKYNISDFKNQYGFIIDDLLDNENAKKFLYFKDEKAVVKNKELDYLQAEEEPNNKNIISFKRYDEETLVKYLLTTNKALLNRIEELEERVKKLEKESE